CIFRKEVGQRSVGGLRIEEPFAFDLMASPICVPPMFVCLRTDLEVVAVGDMQGDAMLGRNVVQPLSDAAGEADLENVGEPIHSGEINVPAAPRRHCANGEVRTKNSPLSGILSITLRRE